MNALLGGLVFGCLVYLAIALAERFSPVGARAGTLRSEALRLGLCGIAAVIGGTLLVHAAPPETLCVIALLSSTLGATCYLVTLEGKNPALLVGASLAVIVGAALLQGDTGPLLSALITGVPFLAAPLVARESNADWRDAIVAGLGGAVFGLQAGLVIVCLACVALAVLRPYLGRNRPQPLPPARFSSALAAVFLLALAGQLSI